MHSVMMINDGSFMSVLKWCMFMF